MDLNKINNYLQTAETGINSLKGGKKIAGTRARASLLNLKKECDFLRKEILDYTKGLTKKAPTKSAPEPIETLVVEATEPVEEEKKFIKKKLKKTK